jgi:hypothetical protein
MEEEDYIVVDMSISIKILAKDLEMYNSDTGEVKTIVELGKNYDTTLWVVNSLRRAVAAADDYTIEQLIIYLND